MKQKIYEFHVFIDGTEQIQALLLIGTVFYESFKIRVHLRVRLERTFYFS
jgi:hypothetical protein